MLHIGLDRVVRRQDILMILDVQKDLPFDTVSFLTQIESRGRRSFCDKCKSVVIVKQGDQVLAIDSPISASTLLKRGSVYTLESKDF